MIYKIECTDIKTLDGTGYNDPPFNLREVSMEEFAYTGFLGHTVTHMEYRQIFVDQDLKPNRSGKMIALTMFWFSNGTGYAISSSQMNKKVHMYLFGCSHHLDNGIISTDRDEYLCSKCSNNIRQDWFGLVNYDSGWTLNQFTSRPQRGIRDYERKISFQKELSDGELTAVKRYLSNVDCPGWTGIYHKNVGATYTFSTCWDSSD